MLCQKQGCTKEATYVAPENWCDYHWAEWWVEGELEGINITPEQKDEAIRLLMSALIGKGGVNQRFMDMYDDFIYRIMDKVLMGPPTNSGSWNVEPIR